MQQVKSNQISNVKEMKPGSAKILELINCWFVSRWCNIHNALQVALK